MSTLTQPMRLRRFERTAVDFSAIFMLLFVLFTLAGSAFWHFWHLERIYSGVTVAATPIGGMTRAVALATLQQELANAPLPPVNLTLADRRWTVDPLQVQGRLALVDAINQAYLVGRQGRLGERVTAQLFASLRGAAITPSIVYDQRLLRDAVATVASQVDRPGRATLRLGALTLPAETGLMVDQDATLQTLLTELRLAPPGQPLFAPLVVKETAPPAAAAVDPAAVTWGPVRSPVLLQDDLFGLELALDPMSLNSLIVAEQPLQLDEARLAARLTELGKPLTLPARDARFHFNSDTGGLTVIQTSQTGRALDVDATVAALRSSLAAGSDHAPLVMKEIAPAVDMNRMAEMGIHELVATGTTYFAGSSVDRMRNIEVAAAKFDGIVIPPGQLFSFNKIVRDVSGANGFEDSLVIWGDRTAVGVGGGVCQVSTTIFRAAYEGGFPIVERYNHGYVVAWYGDPGMDATIYTPDVDFKFRNDTNAYLLIEPVVDTANGAISFNFYGTKPGRTVTIGTPQVTDVKEPDAPTYTVDDSLAAGQQKQVEWPKKGMTVAVQRTIVENGTTRTDTLTSRYQPWRAVYLVGPGTEIPATPTPAAP